MASWATVAFLFHSYWFERDLLGWVNQRRHLTTREKIRWLRQMIKAHATCDAHISWCWTDTRCQVSSFSSNSRAICFAGG